MIVHTHIEVTSAFGYKDVQRLVDMWRHSWESHGFTAVVTTQEFLNSRAGIPLVARYVERVRGFPSINPPGFDRAAFHRWLATYLVSLETQAPIASTEADLINYAFPPSGLQSLNVEKLNITRPEGCPVLAYASSAAYLRLLEKIIAHTLAPEDTINGRPHLSDQDFIGHHLSDNRDPHLHEPDLGVANVFDPEWQKAPLIHFGNPFMQRNGQPQRPKVENIQALLPVPGWHDPYPRVFRQSLWDRLRDFRRRRRERNRRQRAVARA
jgi:hypothetical protein